MVYKLFFANILHLLATSRFMVHFPADFGRTDGILGFQIDKATLAT